MAQSIITAAFEAYKAQQEASAQPVVLDEFVLANVPGQDPNSPIDPDEGLPNESQIVYVADVTQSGYVNPNAVAYSLLMDTRVGDFEFNWVGLRNKASGVLAAISHISPIQKTKSIAGVQNGNAVTRSILMSYQDAQTLTGITVDASTWQIDFTARLTGIDEMERLANQDVFGKSAFLDDGFLVVRSVNTYTAQSGRGYVGGLRCHLDSDSVLTGVVANRSIYLDASWQGQLTSKWDTVFEIKVSASELSDYVDGNGYQHYVTKIADIDAAGNVTDRRYIEGFGQYYQRHLVDDLLDAKVDKTSITDSTSSSSSVLVASAKAVKAAYDLAASKWSYVTATVSRYGAVLLSNSYTGTSQTKATTELALKNGLNTKANSSHTHSASDINAGTLAKERLPNATTSAKGAVQLNNSVTSTSTVLAATANAVKTAYDKGVAALNVANSKWTYVTATTSRYGAAKLSTAVNSTSTTLAATASAVKQAYDLAATKITQAQGNNWWLSKTAKATLTDNDGHGNANLVFNHKDGKPQQNGSAYRWETSTDSNTASVSFEMASNVVAGVVTALTQMFTISMSAFDSKVNLLEKGQRVFSPNNRNISSSIEGTSTTKYASEKAVGDVKALTEIQRISGTNGVATIFNDGTVLITGHGIAASYTGSPVAIPLPVTIKLYDQSQGDMAMATHVGTDVNAQIITDVVTIGKANYVYFKTTYGSNVGVSFIMRARLA